MGNKKYYWLKLKEDFFEEDAIEWMEEQENGKDYCLFYLKLCLKSLKTNGILIRNVGSMLVPYDAKTLARITNTDLDTVKVAMGIFTKIGLVEILENGEIYMTQLKNMVGSETNKAQLMRNKREREKKLLQEGNDVTSKSNNVTDFGNNVTDFGNNVTKSGNNVTQGKENCYTEIEIDIDIEKEKEIDIYIDTDKEILKSFRRLYEQNIGFINGLTAEYLIELSETIEVGLFRKAIEIATDRNKCSLGYIKTIIKNWLNINITTLEQYEAYELQRSTKKDVKSYGVSTKRTEQPKQQIPVDDEKDEEYYRLLAECERLSRE